MLCVAAGNIALEFAFRLFSPEVLAHVHQIGVLLWWGSFWLGIAFVLEFRQQTFEKCVCIGVTTGSGSLFLLGLIIVIRNRLAPTNPNVIPKFGEPTLELDLTMLAFCTIYGLVLGLVVATLHAIALALIRWFNKQKDQPES